MAFASKYRRMERDRGRPVRLYGDVHLALEGPPVKRRHPLVRRLTPADAPLLEAATRAVQGAGYGGPRQLLNEGILTGAVDDERLVAIALTGAITERYADVGVAIHELLPSKGHLDGCRVSALSCHTGDWTHTGLERMSMLKTTRQERDRDRAPRPT